MTTQTIVERTRAINTHALRFADFLSDVCEDGPPTDAQTATACVRYAMFVLGRDGTKDRKQVLAEMGEYAGVFNWIIANAKDDAR